LPKHKLVTSLLKLGPGLITGASDDDPSGIATYSQVGAHFGYGLLWTMPFSYPLMAVIQEISARIGRVTGRGIAGNIRRHYSKPILYGIVSLLLIANIFNLGADIGAMGAAAKLLLPGPDGLTFYFLASLTRIAGHGPVYEICALPEMADAGAFRLRRHGRSWWVSRNGWRFARRFGLFHGARWLLYGADCRTWNHNQSVSFSSGRPLRKPRTCR